MTLDKASEILAAHQKYRKGYSDIETNATQYGIAIDVILKELKKLKSHNRKKANEKKKVSKVAICKKCQCFVKASHISIITPEIEKEFFELFKEGFEIRLETIRETQSRKFSNYSICAGGLCESDK